MELLQKRDEICRELKMCQQSIVNQKCLVYFYENKVYDLKIKIHGFENQVKRLKDYFFAIDWGWSEPESCNEYDDLCNLYKVICTEQQCMEMQRFDLFSLLCCAKNHLFCMQTLEFGLETKLKKAKGRYNF